LWNINGADAFHSFFTGLLFFEKLSLPCNVSAVAFLQDIFPQSRLGFPGNDLAADRCLDGDFELVAGNCFF
jgi:hypothetical protein